MATKLEVVLSMPHLNRPSGISHLCTFSYFELFMTQATTDTNQIAFSRIGPKKESAFRLLILDSLKESKIVKQTDTNMGRLSYVSSKLFVRSRMSPQWDKH